MADKLPFLKTDGMRFADDSGETVILKGVALGGWLMMEGYIMGGRNLPERAFRRSFREILGREAMDDFTRCFRGTFINESDFKLIKEWGANCVRIPFNYRLIASENEPFSLKEDGFKILDDVVKWCGKYGIYCILDMHAVPGAQNPEWHSDCLDQPEFFDIDMNKERYLELWRQLARRYKDESAIAGYDIMNEPVIAVEKERELKDIYDRVTNVIRSEDKRHIIFLEGNMFGQRLDFIGKPSDSNTALSAHAYPMANYVFNFEKDLTYPGKMDKIPLTKKTLNLMTLPYRMLINRINVPLYVGEFGINWRGGYYGELQWVEDILGIFERHGISWTYWTYKSVANYIHPDGVFRYVKSPDWVNRRGPLTGLETYVENWPKHRDEMIASWRTENFKRNEELYNVLKRLFGNNKKY